MKLSDTKLRAIKASGKVQKLTDGKGLYAYVSSSGGISWRIDYSHEGKRKTYTIGQYPAISLLEARKQHLEVKEQLARGVDPSAQKKAVKEATRAEIEDTFEALAREWHTKNKHIWSEKHAIKLLSRFERNLFPSLGHKNINKLTPREILETIRKVEEQGFLELSHCLLGMCSQVFRYAIATDKAERNSASDLRGALKPVKHKNFATITDPKEIALLLQNIDDYTGNFVVKTALKIAPYVFVRPSELRCAVWTEFDFDNAEWRIPAERMKMKQMHIVPLSKQVLKLLIELHKFTGNEKYLFPSMRANSAPISDVTLLAGLRRMGYSKEEMTVHGFRSMASTLLNEQGYNRDWIERQLAHGERDNVRAAYNYAEYLSERKKMMQEWADYLDRLRK